jgi:hypothetical protein
MPSLCIWTLVALGACVQPADGNAPEPEKSAFSSPSEQAQLEKLLEREPGARDRLARELALTAQKAHAAFEQLQRRNDEAYAEQQRRSAARRQEIEKRGGIRPYIEGEVKRLRQFAASAPPPQQEPALSAATSLASQLSPCVLGQPVLFDAPDTVVPEQQFTLSGCNLASGFPTPPKVVLKLDSGASFILSRFINVNSGGPAPEDQKDDSITITLPEINGVFDGQATLTLTTADGKSTQIDVLFRAARKELIVQPPTLLGECSDRADTNHCAGAGGEQLNSFVAYHHRICCGWVAGNDHYFLPAQLAKGWTVSFQKVLPFSAGTGSSCGPAGGPGHITAVEGGEVGSSSIDIRVHWNTAWMCSEIMYIGLVFVTGPKGTSPF